MNTKVTLGCDPEIFLSVNNKFITAEGFFPGTKASPYKLDRGAVQVDGCALEFNIDPAETEDEFEKNISTVLKQLKEMVHMVDKDMEMVFTPIARFDPEYWKNNIPDKAKILGCDPDFNYLGDVNPDPSNLLADKPLRTAAGHVHIGWTEDKEKGDIGHFEDCKYVASSFFKKRYFRPTIESERVRLYYYGNNAAFRNKSYGVELRSPSNLWVENEASRRKIFQETRKYFQEITGL